MDLAIRNIDLRLKNLNTKPLIDISSIEKVHTINKGLYFSNTLCEKALIADEALIDVPKFFVLTQELFFNLENVKIFETTKNNSIESVLIKNMSIYLIVQVFQVLMISSCTV